VRRTRYKAADSSVEAIKVLAGSGLGATIRPRAALVATAEGEVGA
jgi:hypothetical protein